MHAILTAGFLNAGITLGLAGHEVPAQAFIGFSILFGGLVTRDLKRIQRLDKFEREIRG